MTTTTTTDPLAPDVGVALGDTAHATRPDSPDPFHRDPDLLEDPGGAGGES
jgi:hypothetical protein